MVDGRTIREAREARERDEIQKVDHLLKRHTRFLRPKPDAHRMYAHDQVVIHTVRM
jgi:Glu-tRNA(Gln) amidotransferase subunit E-like FAD-binding protein